MGVLNRDVAVHFRDQLRSARATALRDAEDFHEIIFALERIGTYLADRRGTLNTYLPSINSVANHSPMAETIPKLLPSYHQRFEVKYDLVRRARNAALHEGAVARHLTVNAIELSLVLEEAMMIDHHQVSDFMVRNPVCASLWQPLSFIRQMMLVNSYSYLPLPIQRGNNREWCLISDFRLGQYIRHNEKIAKGADARDVLSRTLEDCVGSGEIELHVAKTCEAQATISSIFQMSDGSPILVLAPNGGDLLGILTAFDLL